MQGHKSSITALPENLDFDHGSTSTDTAIESQMPWNTMQASSLNHLPDYEGLNSEWNLGETSSSPTHTQVEHNERKREHIWSIHQCEPSDLLSLDNPDVITNLNQTANGPDALPQDLNISVGPSNEQIPSAGNSSNSYMEESEEDRANCPQDGRRISCKRKALHIGQSSGAGSSCCAQIAESSIGTPTQVENDTVINNRPEQANPRLRLGVGRPASTSPISLPSRGNGEGSRRNFRLRFNGSHHQQQDRIPVNSITPNAANDVRNVDSSSSSRHSSRLMLRNHMVDVNPAENEIPSVRRNHHSRWSGASSSRTSSSSMERDPMLYEESLSRSIPRSISEHPMFVPASEMGGPSQQPTNWSLPGGSNPVAGNVGSGSRASSASGLNSSSPAWSHRNCPPYPRRLSEIVRRSLAGVTESGGQNGNYAMRSGSSAEVTLHSGTPVQHMSNSRAALLERHLDGAFGMPYSFRGLAAGGEGRSSIMSEIRHVLDLMRRGEGLRFEDVMILDHSVFFGMADMHDRHRDMRLDVDNMSYEELLALEERIGNVCTGLSEDTITNHLKQHKYVDRRAEDQAEIEPCSICREEYNDGEDLGSLQCGHDFHKDCIKQWLMHKNLCPICKTTGLTT